MLDTFLDGGPPELFELLGQFTGDHDSVILSECLLEIVQSLQETVDRFVDHDCVILCLQLLEERLPSLLYREEPQESEIVHVHSRCDECTEQC